MPARPDIGTESAAVIRMLSPGSAPAPPLRIFAWSLRITLPAVSDIFPAKGSCPVSGSGKIANVPVEISPVGPEIVTVLEASMVMSLPLALELVRIVPLRMSALPT